ncbi:MAG: hypothetical protein K6A92_02035 [Lachnospiraceae bacterium]|nr:hypothetical protein [Lachnospiraceae bacterium]
METTIWKGNRRWSWVILVIVLGICTVIGIALALRESVRIREFKVDIFVLSSESSVCMAEGPDGLVRLSKENQGAFYSLVEKTRGYFTLDDPQATESVTFKFNCHEQVWELQVDRISEEKLRLHLTGTREYVVYVRDEGLYADFVKLASLDSFNGANKKTG